MISKYWNVNITHLSRTIYIDISRSIHHSPPKHPKKNFSHATNLNFFLAMHLAFMVTVYMPCVRQCVCVPACAHARLCVCVWPFGRVCALWLCPVPVRTHLYAPVYARAHNNTDTCACYVGCACVHVVIMCGGHTPYDMLSEGVI